MDKVFYPIWEAASIDEWLYNGGPYQLIVCHFFLGICCYMGFPLVAKQKGDFLYIKTDSTLSLIFKIGEEPYKFLRNGGLI